MKDADGGVLVGCASSWPKSVLDDAIANCCAALTPTECENFFKSRGYGMYPSDRRRR